MLRRPHHDRDWGALAAGLMAMGFFLIHEHLDHGEGPVATWSGIAMLAVGFLCLLVRLFDDD